MADDSPPPGGRTDATGACAAADPAKRELRRALRLARSNQTNSQRAAAAALLATDRVGLAGRIVAGYLPTASEPDVGPLLGRAARVLLPIPEPQMTLGWAVADGTRTRHEHLPVDQPAGPRIGSGAATLLDAQVSLILVPALAVSRDGWRLGQGGGFYDNLLAELAALGSPGSAPPRVVAVVFDGELLAAGTVPHDPHDRPVPWVLTPSGLHRVG